MPKVTLDISQHKYGIQVSIGDERTGHRLAGPKFDGTSVPIKKIVLTQQNADEIRGYLDVAFPAIKKEEEEGDYDK